MASAALQAIPRDSARKEHIGMLDRVVWSDAERPVTIMRLTDGKSVVADAAPHEFARGQKYRFLGRWEEGKFGPQFRASTYTRDDPHTRAGVVKYLSDVCEGVGAKIAERLWSHFDTNAVRMLREDPEAVAAAGVMGLDAARDAARDLARYAGLEQTRIDLFGLFAGRGFPGKLVEHAISRWGAKAPAIVRADPFRLLTARLPGCGWRRCDKLYIDQGGRPTSLKRQALAAWNALREDRTGSTWLPATAVIQAVQDAVPIGNDPIKAIKLGIRGGLLRIRRDGDSRWIAVANHARAEKVVADCIANLKGPTEWPTDIPVSASPDDKLPSRHQAEQIIAATASPIGCFVGGPGTGKTHTLAHLIRRIASQWGLGSVAVVAPTGKAATRATESLANAGVPIRATTIHSLLMTPDTKSDPWVRGHSGFEFCRHADNPLRERFVIVDESSMVNTDLLADLLSACQPSHFQEAQPEVVIDEGGTLYPSCLKCGRTLKDPASWDIGFGPHCARFVDPSQYQSLRPIRTERRIVTPAIPEGWSPGTHVLFVGDPFQLPPVGHGAPLRDMLAAGVAQGQLTEVRRNAGLIVRGCIAIKNGESPDFASRIDLDSADPANLRFIDCRPADTLTVIESVLRSTTRFDPVWDCQILTATNDRGPASRRAVNDHLAKILNPDGRRVDPIPFAVGDKVILLSNSRLPVATAAGAFADPAMAELAGNYVSHSTERAFVANGEVGRVTAVSEKGMVPTIGQRLVWVAKSKPRSDDAEEGESGGGGAMGDWDLAYGITTHKSQGGEWPLVIVIADKSGGGVADRNWWYTAISRASKACLVVGDRAAFETQCRRQSIAQRKTFLTELIKGES